MLTWVLSALLSPVEFAEADPRTCEQVQELAEYYPGGEFRRACLPLRIANQLTGAALATFLSQMVTTFTGFAPLGVVLVTLLGVGVAEKTGFINAGRRCSSSASVGT